MAKFPFEDDYKVAITNTIKDLYKGTDYWGVGPSGNEGIIKPINDEDDPNWSNYNFINTNRIVRDTLIIPYLETKEPINIEHDKSYKESENNTNFFKLLWKYRDELFGLNSFLKNDIIKKINSTRKKGEKGENFVKLVLESFPGITVVVESGPGSSIDFSGIDVNIKSTNPVLRTKSAGSTAQVKSFGELKKDNSNWVVTTDLKRDYNTDYLIFAKTTGQEVHLAIFKNEPELFTVEKDNVIIPLHLGKLLVNYNLITKKKTFKSY